MVSAAPMASMVTTRRCWPSSSPWRAEGSQLLQTIPTPASTMPAAVAGLSVLPSTSPTTTGTFTAARGNRPDHCGPAGGQGEVKHG